jgi:hypothetical protein
MDTAAAVPAGRVGLAAGPGMAEALVRDRPVP